MARVNVQLVLLVVLAAVVVFSVPAMAARGRIIRQPFERHREMRPFFHRRAWYGVLCIPQVAQLLEEHEGRHECAYDHENGFRAVGIGYNLDDDVEQRRKELSAALADYDKVYKGESCLNDLQISGLLLLDGKRALDRVEENVKPLNDFCCSIQAVFADIQHASGPAEKFPARDLEKFIERAAMEHYKSAAHALGKTEWCSRKENQKRCDDNLDVVAEGC